MTYLSTIDLEKAKKLTGKTKYELIDKLAEALQLPTSKSFAWTKRPNCIAANACKIGITTRKDKTIGLAKIEEINVFGDNQEWENYVL